MSRWVGVWASWVPAHISRAAQVHSGSFGASLRELSVDSTYRGISGAVGFGYRFTVKADPATRPKKGVVRFYC